MVLVLLVLDELLQVVGNLLLDLFHGMIVGRVSDSSSHLRELVRRSVVLSDSFQLPLQCRKRSFAFLEFALGIGYLSLLLFPSRPLRLSSRLGFRLGSLARLFLFSLPADCLCLLLARLYGFLYGSYGRLFLLLLSACAKMSPFSS